MKGKWKTVELDPSVFSEEGLEGLVCFEELTNYRLIDTAKAAAKAAKQLKKEKEKAKKRKVSESEEAGEKGEDTTQPAKKKAKKKKKNKKVAAKESVESHDDGKEDVTQDDKAASEAGGENKVADDDTLKESLDVSVQSTQSSKAKMKDKKKKKKSMRLTDKGEVTEEQPNLESSSEKEKSSQGKLSKKTKKQTKNWTNAARSGPDDKNSDVSAWKDLFVPSPVLKALSSLGFSSPSPIQALALPPAIRDHMDILGAAETGKIKLPFIFKLSTFFPPKWS